MGKVTQTPLPTIHPPQQLAHVFCDYFSTKISDIRTSLDNQASTLSSTDDVVQERSFSGSPLVQFDTVSEDTVRETMTKMLPKTCALDPVPTNFLFDCADVVLPCLTDILNSIILNCSVPDSMKKAIVKPLLKKPSLDPNVLKNFRPVSNLTFVSKLLEKIVLSQILSHLDQNGLWHIFQSAYRPCHSVETALLRVTNDLLMANDSDQTSVLALLDLSAAFDTIDHDLLLCRLRQVFGIQGGALSFLESYLSGREQVVSVLGYESDPCPLKYGVPQGSVLGPILFILYTQPLSDIMACHSVPYHLFADDTELYKSDSPSEIEHTLSSMQSCISDVRKWSLSNKLQMNDGKTEILLLDPSDSCLHSSLMIGQTNIQFSAVARNLGVLFDNKLSMTYHVNKTCQIAYCEIRKISSIRRYLTTEATKTLVTSLVLSRLDFCNSLLAGLPQLLLDKLQRVMNAAARLVTRTPKREHITPVLHDLHWLPVRFRIEYKICTLCFNIVSGSAPPYLSQLLELYTPSRTLRSSADTRKFRIPKRKKKTQGQRSFSYIGPVIWNDLPFSVRHAQSLSAFKSALKHHLFLKSFQ